MVEKLFRMFFGRIPRRSVPNTFRRAGRLKSSVAIAARRDSISDWICGGTAALLVVFVVIVVAKFPVMLVHQTGDAVFEIRIGELGIPLDLGTQQRLDFLFHFSS